MYTNNIGHLCSLGGTCSLRSSTQYYALAISIDDTYSNTDPKRPSQRITYEKSNFHFRRNYFDQLNSISRSISINP